MKQHIVYHLDANDIKAALTSWAASRMAVMHCVGDRSIFGVELENGDLYTAVVDYVRERQKLGTATLKVVSADSTAAEVIVK